MGMSGLIHKLKERSGKELGKLGEGAKKKKKRKKSLYDRVLAHMLRNDTLHKPKKQKK
jgi:hypothetical protein